MTVRHKLVKVASLIVHQNLCTGWGVKRFFSIHHVWCDGSKSSLDFCVNHENVVDSFIYPDSFHIPDSKGSATKVTTGKWQWAGQWQVTYTLHSFALHLDKCTFYIHFHCTHHFTPRMLWGARLPHSKCQLNTFVFIFHILHSTTAVRLIPQRALSLFQLTRFIMFCLFCILFSLFCLFLLCFFFSMCSFLFVLFGLLFFLTVFLVSL